MAERLLLDTHAIIWMALDPSQLSGRAVAAIEDADNALFFSPVSAMEIATKVRIGKLDLARPLAAGFVSQMTDHGVVELPLRADHAEVAGSLPGANQDPWDRLLAAQAKMEGMALVTADRRMSAFAVATCW